ncbi:MAG: hypothetical protein WC285_01855 [Candidatus Gracilibacteria bacterium]|jgi:hypothetical protein
MGENGVEIPDGGAETLAGGSSDVGAHGDVLRVTTGAPAEEPVVDDVAPGFATEADIAGIAEEVGEGAKAVVPTGPIILTRTTKLNEADRRDLETRFFSPSVNGLRKAFERGKLVLPTDDQILAVLLQKFTPDNVEALRRAIQVPGLLALPWNQTFAASVALLNANKKRQGQLDVGVYGSRRAVFEEQDRLVIARGGTPELKFGFGEMIPEPTNRGGLLRDIITEWLRDSLAEISVTADQDMYAQLQAQASGLLDLTGWTMLGRKDEPVKIKGEDGLVSGGYGTSGWGGGAGAGVGFVERDLGRIYDYARVRPVVMG